MKNNLFNVVSRAMARTNLKIKKNSPEILLGMGVTGIVASTITACKATTKVSEIISETKEQIEQVHEVLDKEELTGRYTVEDSKKDLVIIYTQTAIKIAKNYAPAIVMGTLSLGCILVSHKILRGRNLALATAYAAVDKSFKRYRKNVISRFGEEIDKELRYNIETKEIERKVVDDKGKETTVKEQLKIANYDPNEYSEYAKFFDESNRNFQKNPEYNLMFLRTQQDYATMKLKNDGFLFLNDVYDALGIPKTEAGQIVGWIYDENDPERDNCVDFGIYNIHRVANRDFINGIEPVILLDFNVDGDILHELSKKRGLLAKI